MTRTWTCQRVTAGTKCGATNPRRKQLCQRCGKRRPATKRPAHLAALNLPYEHYIEINGGEHCGICGAQPKPNRKLDRDHEHSGDGHARGLLCPKCNRALVGTRFGLKMTPEWLRAAADYLERSKG